MVGLLYSSFFNITRSDLNLDRDETLYLLLHWSTCILDMEVLDVLERSLKNTRKCVWFRPE